MTMTNQLIMPMMQSGIDHNFPEDSYRANRGLSPFIFYPEAWREYMQLQDSFAGNDMESPA